MFAEVIVDITHSNVDKVFEYSIPDNLHVEIGARVLVPFGVRKNERGYFVNRTSEGFVVNIKEKADFDESKIKAIIEVLDDMPPLTIDTINLANFVEKKYHSLKSEVLRLMIPAEMRGGRVKEKEKTYIKINYDIPYDEAIRLCGKASKQLELVDIIYGGENDFTLLNKNYSSSIKSLEKKGIIVLEKEQVIRTPYEFIEVEKEEFQLTPDQNRTIESINNTDKLVTLIHGVTGCGKTEIYLRCIEKALSKGQTAIFLVPEIALTPQMVGHLRARFGDDVAIIHSGLSAGERYDEWWRLRKGDARIVVGARSAIFAPLKNIGIIIVDEEHESSYISEMSPRYSTIDVAKYRAQHDGAKLVLGSATPSVESYYLARNGEYNLVEIDKRINNQILPNFIIVDMKQQLKHGNKTAISSVLRDELSKTLDNKNQAIIFLNRRGFSSYYQCLSCGYVCKCNTCDVSLNYHKYEKALKCHYCGTKYQMPRTCPECGNSTFNLGKMGTEKVVEEIQNLFPNARILRMDADTTSTKDSHNKILQEFREKKADILVGTQMVAKGHDFPAVTLVGIIDADQSLYYTDFRSGERTFQLITQVSGRAGRADKEGLVVLQTYSPHHFILNYATHYKYKDFFDYEIASRKITLFPPFADVIRVMVVSSDENKVKLITRKIYNDVKIIKDKNPDAFVYFNGMKSPVSMIENKFRYQIIARLVGDNRNDIIEQIYKVIDSSKDVNVTSYLEINPSNMF